MKGNYWEKKGGNLSLQTHSAGVCPFNADDNQDKCGIRSGSVFSVQSSMSLVFCPIVTGNKNLAIIPGSSGYQK